ncbi:MAG: DUF86 domain-containing protein [Candidatus Andersenbacteria bacterium]
MSIDKQLVLQKCKYVIQDIERIRMLLDELSYEELASDEIKGTAAERYLERVVNRSIDINFHIVGETNNAPPDTYTDSFLLLAKIGVLSDELARNVAPAAGVRNILVHEYDDLDMQKFYASLENITKYFPGYIKAVTDFIERSV